MMKKYFVMIAASIILVGCKGKDEKATEASTAATPAKTPSAPNVAEVQDPVTDAAEQETPDFVVRTDMQHTSYKDFFTCDVSADGNVSCQFHNLDDPMFVFDPACGTDPIQLQTFKGRCLGASVLLIGGAQDPVLYLLMEDGNIEMLMLWEIASGMRCCNYRTTQGGVVKLASSAQPTQADIEAGSEGADVEGYDAEGNLIALDWGNVNE